MKKILVTRKLIKSSEELAKKLFEVKLNKEDKILSKEELIRASEGYDGILSHRSNPYLLKHTTRILEYSSFRDKKLTISSED